MESLWDRPIYPAAEAGRLVGLTSTRVHRWLRGYDYRYASSDGAGTVRRQKPVVHRVGTIGTSYASFLDLIDLLFVKQFLDHSLSLQKLRKALQEASEIIGTDHFAWQTFFTDGKSIYLQVKEHGNAILELLSGGQWVIAPIITQLADRIDFDTSSGLARRWYPQGHSGYVVVDPLVSFGRPALINRRTTTANVYDLYMAEKGNLARVCSWMCLDEKEVKAAVQFEESLAA